MEIGFKNKVVIVTGAGGGLGSAMAENFAENGAAVAVCDVSNPESVVNRIVKNGGKAKAFSFDLTNRDDVAEGIARITESFGKIDVLVNNAGINVGPDKRDTIERFDDKWWDAILKVDLTGTYNCSKAALMYMNDGGCIVNISSITGMIPLRNQCAFTAAKAGVINLSKAMALELAPRKIRVNIVAPGTMQIAITNDLWKNDAAMKDLLGHIPMGRQGVPQEIADAVMFLASERAAYITGALLAVDGGWSCGYARDI